MPSTKDNLAHFTSDNLHPCFQFLEDCVSGFLFNMLTALAGEKSLYRPLIFNELTALGALSIHGHKVCRLLVQFVSLVVAPRTCHPPTRSAPGAPGLNFEPIIKA
jgi:hypothetical protein